MGSIARSLQRAGYLKPTVDSLYGYLQRRRYEQGLQQLAEMLSGSENRMRDIYESKAYNTMEPSRTESNIDVNFVTGVFQKIEVLLFAFKIKGKNKQIHIYEKG